MNNGKFNMFEGMDSEEENEVISNPDEMEYDNFDPDADESEILSSTMLGDTKKKYGNAVPTRSVEEYNALIESVYFETHYHPVTGEPYEVKVTVFKPEINPMELLRPAFAFSSQH